MLFKSQERFTHMDDTYIMMSDTQLLQRVKDGAEILRLNSDDESADAVYELVERYNEVASQLREAIRG
jgi:hypothetical protein